MRNDLQQRGRIIATSIPALPAALVAFGLALSAGTALAAPDPAAKGAFLLIDGGAPAGQPRLAGCDRSLADLHAALDRNGTPNTVLLAPTAGALREALLRFGNANTGGANAVLFCGYATEAGGNVFALGSDFAPHDDPALSAVSIRAFSRVSGDKNGLVVLNMHPVAAEGAPVAAIAGALDGAAGAWSTDPGLTGTRIAATDKSPADATLIARAAQTGATTPDAMARALSVPTATTANEPSPQTSTQTPPPATPPVKTAEPAASGNAPPADAKATDTKVADAKPAGTDTATRSGDDKTTPAPDGKTDATQPTPDHAEAAKSGEDAGAMPLAPKPPAAATRPRVHVDPAIRRIQVALLARGLFSGRVNGVNNADTQRGIKHFQAMLGHPVTGALTADETRQLTGG